MRRRAWDGAPLSSWASLASWASCAFYGSYSLCLSCALGCTPPGRHEGTLDAAPQAIVSDDAHRNSSSPPQGAAALQGAHDYRGTLGSSTAIAVHLDATGGAVSGSYVYVAIGRPIR